MQLISLSSWGADLDDFGHDVMARKCMESSIPPACNGIPIIFKEYIIHTIIFSRTVNTDDVSHRKCQEELYLYSWNWIRGTSMYDCHGKRLMLEGTKKILNASRRILYLVCTAKRLLSQGFWLTTSPMKSNIEPQIRGLDSSISPIIMGVISAHSHLSCTSLSHNQYKEWSTYPKSFS